MKHLLLFLLLLMAAPGFATTYFVKTDGNDTFVGRSWSTAFATLQKALATAQNGDQIWVAKGTYYPTTDPTDRSAYFTMRTRVNIYGGFAGTETNLNDRNWTTNPTILSGDIDHATDPLMVRGSGSTLSITGNGGNSYHVIFNNDNSVSTTILDGFTITGGNADGSDGDNSNGGGMLNKLASPQLSNLIFSGNSATNGGGMYSSRSSPQLSNLIFSGNLATNGGGMYSFRSASQLSNLIFSGNLATNGGGMYNGIITTISLNNASFSGNSATNGGGMYNKEASPSLSNCILWGNGEEVYDDNSSPTYAYTLIKGLNLGSGVFDGTQDPLFVNAANPAGADGVFATADDGLALHPCSSVLNKGDNTDSPVTDITSRTRIVGDIIDLGAYECQAASPTTLYVNQAVASSGDGTSWASAFKTLQEALQISCRSVTQIWVAKGTYYPTTDPTDRSAYFTMRSRVNIYGGFAGTETNLNDRNWTTNPTILSGDIDHATDPLVVRGSGSTLSITGNGGNSYHVIYNLDNSLATSLLDGFTITGGNADGSDGSNSTGGGMLNRFTSPQLSNLIFSGNSATNGGGMYSFRSASKLSNLIFSGNLATNGGGMYNDRSTISLNNASFSGNSATNGGGMYNKDASPSLSNCILWGNGEEVYDDNSSPTYAYTLVKGLNLGSGVFDGTQDPLFVSQSGDLRLQACSPAINAGDNSLISNDITVDLANNPRIFNNGTVDLGAYEYQGDPVAQPIASASTSTAVICVGNTINLSASGGSNFSWSGPSGSNFNSTAQKPSFMGSSASYSGLYSVTVSNANCLLTATATVSVQIKSSITISVSFVPVCLVGNPLNLSASGGDAYRWRGPNSFSSTSASPIKAKTVAKDEGVYSVTVTGNGGCTASSSIRVYYGIGAGAISIANRSPYCKGGPITLMATAAGARSYQWKKQFGSATFTGNPVTITTNAKASDGGLYNLFVTGENGCIEKQETLVTVSQVACVGTRLAGEEVEEIEMTINAYPNPVTNILTVEVTLQKPSKLSLSLFNSVGKESGTWQLNQESTVHKTELNMSELTGGVYLLQAQAGQQKVVKRVVKIQY